MECCDARPRAVAMRVQGSGKIRARAVHWEIVVHRMVFAVPWPCRARPVMGVALSAVSAWMATGLQARHQGRACHLQTANAATCGPMCRAPGRKGRLLRKQPDKFTLHEHRTTSRIRGEE